MYLKKEVTTSHGVVADCWGLVRAEVVYDVVTMLHTCNGNLNLYVNDSARRSGATLLDSCAFQLSGLTHAQVNNNIVPTILGMLMAAVEDGGREWPTTFSGSVNFADAIPTESPGE